MAADIHKLGLKWHVPSEDELLLADRLLLEFLQPEVDKLKRFMKGEAMDR